MTRTQLSATERFLRIFTEVRPGEGPTALLMFANVFLILCAYYFVKPLREGWMAISPIEGLSKTEIKAYTSFGQSLLLLPIVGWYGQLAGIWGRGTLITRATLFCIANIAIFWTIQPGLFIEGWGWSGIVFYLWVGMFGVFVVAQFWTFCADIYTDERGKRMMPMIAIGATSGAAFGSWMVGELLNNDIVGLNWLLAIATVPLFASILLTRLVENREHLEEPKPSGPGDPSRKEDEASLLDGAKLVFISRFILAAAAVTLLVNWVNTNGENLLYRVINEALAAEAVEEGITDPDAIREFTRAGVTAFYGNFFFWVNIVALLLQSIVASRLLKYGGFAAILLMLPVISLISYTAMAFLPILGIVKVMKIAENATDYSINNTARHVLWLPVSSEMKFRGKPAIDTLYVRIGDGFAALTILIGERVLRLATASFFIFNVGLVMLWFAFAFLLIREHRKASEAVASHGGA